MNKLFFSLAIVAAAAASFAQSKLTGFQWSKVGDGLKVQVEGENLSEPKALRVNHGRSLLVEFSASLVGKAKNETVKWAGVDSIRAGWFTPKPAKVRIAFKLDADATYKVEQVDGQWVIWINTDGAGAAKPAIKNIPANESAFVHIVADNVPNVPVPLAKYEEPKKEQPKQEQPKAQGRTPVQKVAAKPAPVFEPLPALPKKDLGSSTAITAMVGPATNQLIDLEFVNTEVVQVLRAIALEGDANIVTAPDVKGVVTVALNRVSVREALDLVTSLAGLSYGISGKTFVVAADPARLNNIARAATLSDTRVVPIFSGEGTQIKAAVLKTIAPDSTKGAFEIVLPSEEVTVETKSTVSEGGLAADEGAKGADQGTSVKTKTGDAKTAKKDTYVVLIGPAARLDALEMAVKRIDGQICAALGMDMPESNAMVRETYYPKGTKAAFLLASIAGGTLANPSFAKIGTVEAYATPVTSIGEQAITLHGRQNEVTHLLQNLKALDQVGDGADQMMVYDVKFLDPRGVKQDLENQIPGLSVSVLPAPATSPGLFKEQTKEQTSSGSTQSSQTNTQGSSGAAGAATDDGKLNGITLPYSDMEKQAFPMRVLLRGGREKIEKALAYLTVVDIEPKQVALQLHVMDLSKEDAERMGIDWGLLTQEGLNFGRINQGLGDSAASGGTVSSSANLGGKLLNVVATLDSADNKRKLIARPNIFAQDGRQAELFVGDVIRYIESIQSTQQGITVTTKELPIGVRMAVLPRIGGSGNISLDVRPVVSTLNGFTPVPGGGQLPQTSLRIAQNTLTMQDGETIAIGGLIQENDVKRVSGLPFLKDLPILGKLLFSRTDNSKKKTELVFFLTAKIVSQESRGDAANPGIKRDGGK